MEIEEVGKKVGEHLRAAREVAGLSRAQVAESLRLRVSVIEAIEAGNLEVGVPTTFIRGYIKNYARLLGVPTESTVPLLENLREDNHETELIPPRDSAILLANHFNWRWWLAFTALVTGGLFLFAYLR